MLICLTVEELPIVVGQPVAWSELVVSILIDVRRAHFYSALGGASCGSLHGQEQSWPFAQEHVWLQRRGSESGIRETEIGFVQVKPSPASTDILKGISVCGGAWR